MVSGRDQNILKGYFCVTSHSAQRGEAGSRHEFHHRADLGHPYVRELEAFDLFDPARYPSRRVLVRTRSAALADFTYASCTRPVRTRITRASILKVGVGSAQWLLISDLIKVVPGIC